MLSDVSLNNSIFIVSFSAAVEQTSIEKLFLCIVVFVADFPLPSSSLSLACMRCLWSSKSENKKKFSHYFDSSPLIKMNEARVAGEKFSSLFFLYLLAALCWWLCSFGMYSVMNNMVLEKWDDKNKQKKDSPTKKRERIKLCTVNTWWFSMEIKAVLLKKDLL